MSKPLQTPSSSQPEPIPVTPEVLRTEEEYKLPSLTGSTRQIAWARNIRHQMIVDLGSKWLDLGISNAAAAYDTMRKEERASMWIDHRHYRGKAQMLFKRVAHELLQRTEAEQRIDAEADVLLR